MDKKSSEAGVQPKLFPIVTERDFVLIFISFFERLLHSTVSSDISRVITMYVVTRIRNRIIWINNSVCKSETIDILDGVTVTKGRCDKSPQSSSILCGDGTQLDSTRGTEYEVVFKINKLSLYGFFIGYVYGSIHDVDVECELGDGTNRMHSVGIEIGGNKYYLFDEDHSSKQFNCVSVPGQGQIWRVTWDLANNKMEISVMNKQETDWIDIGIRYAMKQEHQRVIPAFSLFAEGDSITLVRE